MYQDHKGLLSAFHAHGVRYLIVGNDRIFFAVVIEGHRPLFLIKGDAENARAVRAALIELGAPLQEVRPEDFADQGAFFRFGLDPRRIDILTEIPGGDFDSAWERRVEQVIDPGSGLKANFIDVFDLIAIKLGVAKREDIADAIRKAAELGELKDAPKLDQS